MLFAKLKRTLLFTQLIALIKQMMYKHLFVDSDWSLRTYKLKFLYITVKCTHVDLYAMQLCSPLTYSLCLYPQYCFLGEIVSSVLLLTMYWLHVCIFFCSGFSVDWNANTFVHRRRQVSSSVFPREAKAFPNRQCKCNCFLGIQPEPGKVGVYSVILSSPQLPLTCSILLMFMHWFRLWVS